MTHGYANSQEQIDSPEGLKGRHGGQMSDMETIISQFPNANLSINVDGSPNYDSGRVIVRGNADGFRVLADVLRTMADAVATAEHAAAQHGWQLGLSHDDLGWLKMDDSILVLDCSP